MSETISSEEWKINWQKFVHSYLKQRNWMKSLHSFECDTQIYFDMGYCRKLFVEAKWNDCLDYLNSFIDPSGNNEVTRNLYFTVYKEIFLYHLERKDNHRALEIVGGKIKNLCVSAGNKSIFSELINLLFLERINQHEKLRNWKDDETYRSQVFDKQIETSIATSVRGKTTVPILDALELTKLFEKSLELQRSTLQQSSKKSTKTDEHEKKEKRSLSSEKNGSSKKTDATHDTAKRKLSESDDGRIKKRRKSKSNIQPSRSPSSIDELPESDIPTSGKKDSGTPIGEKTITSEISTSGKKDSGTLIGEKIMTSETSTSGKKDSGTPIGEKNMTSETFGKKDSGNPIGEKNMASEISTYGRKDSGTPIGEKNMASDIFTSGRKDPGTPISEKNMTSREENDSEKHVSLQTQSPTVSTQTQSTPTSNRTVNSPPITPPLKKPMDKNKLINLLPRNHLLEIKFRESIIKAAVFHPINTQLLLVGTTVTSSGSNSLSLFDLKSGKIICQYLLGVMKKPKQLVWALDGAYFAVSFEEESSFGVFIMNDTQIQLAPGWEDFGGDHTGIILDIKFDPFLQKPTDGSSEKIFLVTGSADGLCKVWDVASRRCVFFCESKGQSRVCAVSVFQAAPKKVVLITTHDEQLMGFMIPPFEEQAGPQKVNPRFNLNCPAGRVDDMHIADNRFFCCGTEAGTLIEIQKKDGLIAYKYQPYLNGEKKQPRFTVSGETIAIGDGDKVKFWNIDLPEMLYELSINGPVKLAVLSNNTKLLSVVLSNSLQVYASNSEMSSFKVEQESIFIEEMVPVPSSNFLGRIPILSISNGLELSNPHTEKVVKLLYSHNKSSLCSLDATGLGKSWKWAEGVSAQSAPETFATISTETETVTKGQIKLPTMSLSSNDAYMVMSLGGCLDLFNNVTRKRVTSIHKPDPILNTVPTAVKFDPSDNNYLAVGLANGQIMIKLANRNQQWYSPDGHNGAVTDVSYSKVDKQEGTLVTAGQDSMVIIWKITITSNQKPTEGAASLKILTKLQISDQKQSTFIEIGSTYLLVTQSTQIQLWIWESMQKVHEWKAPENNPIVSACFGAKAEIIYVLLTSHICYILSPKLVPIGQLQFDNQIVSLVAHPSLSYQIATGGADGSVSILEIDKKDLLESD